MPSRCDVDRQLAGALRGVDVEQHAALAAQSPDRADVLHDADLVVHVHERDQQRVRAQRLGDLLRLDDAARARLEVGDAATFALELPARIEHGRMLGARR